MQPFQSYPNPGSNQLPSQYPSPSQYPNPYPVPYRPVGVPPVQLPLKRIAILGGLAVAALIILGGGYFLYKKVAPQHEVIVDNGNDFAVEVEVGGEKLSLAPKKSATVKVGDGKLTVKATGPNGFSETASVELPESSVGTSGRTAVYNVGGKSGLAIVSVTYGHVAGAPKPIVRIPAEPRLALLPPGDYGALDGSFPKEITTSRRRSGALIQHVCHVVDGEEGKFGCAGLEALD